MHPGRMGTTVRVFRPGEPGLEILHVRDCSPSIPAHVHASWCVLAVERGRRVVTSAGQALCLNPGDAAVIPPGVAHACASPAPGCAVWAVSIPSGLCDFDAQVSDAPEGMRYLPGRGLAARLARLLDGPDRPEWGAIARLLAPVGPSRAGGAPLGYPPLASPAVQAARALLDGQGGAELSLEELARRAGASPFHLARRFRSETGVTPHEYLTLARLRKARAFLSRGFSLADAAVASGFYDQSHLNLRFRKYMGMTPGQFARAAR